MHETGNTPSPTHHENTPQIYHENTSLLCYPKAAYKWFIKWKWGSNKVHCLFSSNFTTLIEHNGINEEHRHQNHTGPMVWSGHCTLWASCPRCVVRQGASVRPDHLACHTKQTLNGCRGGKGGLVLDSHFCQGRKAVLIGFPEGQWGSFLGEWRLQQIVIQFSGCLHWWRHSARLHEAH